MIELLHHSINCHGEWQLLIVAAQEAMPFLRVIEGAFRGLVARLTGG